MIPETVRMVLPSNCRSSMRITVTHKKTQQEVVKIVDDSAEQVFRGMPGSPIQIVDYRKSWDGSLMHFSFVAKMGFLTTPLRGTVLVTERDVTVEFELPALLKSFIPEQKIEESMKSRIRGLLS
jgi:hypothetical protein